MSNTFQWKKWARKKEEVAHKTCPLMFYQRKESCPDSIGEALPTPPIIQGSAAAKSLQSCPTVCDPIDSSPPDYPTPGILQARTLEWVAISFSNAWKWKAKMKVKVKSCPTLSDPMDCSLPGSSIHGIFQARVLEWGAIELMATGG